eukprot:5154514-Pyramimonas_sp.AAC.1
MFTSPAACGFAGERASPGGGGGAPGPVLPEPVRRLQRAPPRGALRPPPGGGEAGPALARDHGRLAAEDVGAHPRGGDGAQGVGVREADGVEQGDTIVLPTRSF